MLFLMIIFLYVVLLVVIIGIFKVNVLIKLVIFIVVSGCLYGGVGIIKME